MTGAQLDEIAAYYDYTEPFYRRFWHGDTGGVHYGLWDADTRSFREALLNTNRFLARVANIAAGEKVLDAGCGVGGSALWLAANTGAQVTGITISRKQLAAAEAARRNAPAGERVAFRLADFTRTDFPDAQFDVVWAVESVCHVTEKSRFLAEAQRVLKPGGRLVLADGFLDRQPANAREARRLASFCHGFVLPGLAEAKGFDTALRGAGFENIRYWDKTANILPSSRRMRRISLWSWPVSALGQWMGLTPPLLTANNRTGLDQRALFEQRVLGYYVFLASKRCAR
jgi:cyclopropane fatty-acyl-phospholipid synthase-like methyltransferase